MRIEIFHASKYGNGAKVAEELRRVLVAKGHEANVHHVSQSRPKEMPQADLYIFGSPGRMGKPIGSMRRFLKKVVLPKGTRYALFATTGVTMPDKKTGKMPDPAEIEKYQHVLAIMQEILNGKGLVKVAETKFYVVAAKGPLQDGWEASVAAYAAQLA